MRLHGLHADSGDGGNRAKGFAVHKRLGFRGGALHSCSEGSAVEPTNSQMGNVD